MKNENDENHIMAKLSQEIHFIFNFVFLNLKSLSEIGVQIELQH